MIKATQLRPCVVCGDEISASVDDVMCGRCELYVGDDDSEIGVARLHPYWLDYYVTSRRPPDRLNAYSDGENPGWYAWHWARARDTLTRHVKRRIPERLRLAVIARDGYVCQLCGGVVKPADVHIDHVLPESMGGPAVLDNLQVAHSFCNISKGARIGERAP